MSIYDCVDRVMFVLCKLIWKIKCFYIEFDIDFLFILCFSDVIMYIFLL